MQQYIDDLSRILRESWPGLRTHLRSQEYNKTFNHVVFVLAWPRVSPFPHPRGLDDGGEISGFLFGKGCWFSSVGGVWRIGKKR